MRAGRCVAAATESCGALSSFIDVTGAPLQLRGSTAKSTNDAQLGCAVVGSSGPDVLFGLRLAERRRFTATVRPIDPASGFQPVIGLRSDCAVARSEIGCGFTMPGGDRATLVTEVGQGTFFLWVDSETEIGGDFELELSFDDAPRVDSCTAPGVLRGTELIDVSGETIGLSDDVAASCGGMGTPDAVYSLTLEQARRVRIEAVGLSGFRPTLALRRSCTDVSTELGCAAALASTGTAAIELPSLEPGAYSVLVDGPPSGAVSGRFRLRVTLTEPVPAPTNDTCETALELVATSGSGTVTVQGDTTRAKNDAAGCDGTGPELVYALQLATAQHVRALVTPLAGGRLLPTLYLRRENQCASEFTREQLFCVAAGQAGFPALLEVPRLEAGRWYLFVDGKAGTAGAFDLSVELTPPPAAPANDLCSRPTVLPVANGPVFLPNETTVGATANALTCVDSPSPDVVYTFELTTRQSIAIDARALPGSRLLPAVTLKPTGICSLTAPLPVGKCGLSDLQVPDRAVAIAPALDPGSYTLWVSGDLATQGAFSLRVVPGPVFAQPTNDTCSSANAQQFTLNIGSSLNGDTRGAGNTTEGRCGLPTGANGEVGADVAYTFQVASPTPSLTISVQPDAVGGALLRPVLYVRGGASANNLCTSYGANLGCTAAPDFGAAATLSLTNVMPGLYTVWVDGAGFSAGSFTLSIR